MRLLYIPLLQTLFVSTVVLVANTLKDLDTVEGGWLAPAVRDALRRGTCNIETEQTYDRTNGVVILALPFPPSPLIPPDLSSLREIHQAIVLPYTGCNKR